MNLYCHLKVTYKCQFKLENHFSQLLLKFLQKNRGLIKQCFIQMLKYTFLCINNTSHSLCFDSNLCGGIVPMWQISIKTHNALVL